LRIISFDSARVTWLFPIEEFAPAATSNPGVVLAGIATRYNFTRTPTITTREDMANNGLVFGLGHFQFNGETVGITDFIIYNDGIVAISQKTEWAEAFLEDLFNWVKENFGFRDLSSGIRKLFTSTLVVDFDSPLSGLISGYDALSGIITSRTMTIMRDRKPMQFSRLDFEVDKRTLDSGQVALPKFILERRPGVGFEQERWFSIAPMHTAQHVEVLAEIEVLASTVSVPIGVRQPS
jgi:hypothetical protein